MCKKVILYSPGNQANARLVSRKRNRNLNFKQIRYSTDCIREYANMHEVPMAEAVSMLQAKEQAMNTIFTAARQQNPISPKQVAKQVSVM